MSETNGSRLGIDVPIRVGEMFAGYGGASFALKKSKLKYETIWYSEVDKNAIKCYEQNFPNVKNFGDCTKINTEELPDFDLLTGGFPCVDVSIAGDRDLSKGRTNLYVEILRIAKAKQPKFMLLENVTGLLSMGKRGDKLNSGLLIDKIVRDLKGIGYGVCWKVLNSKDYGIPQNRERVWIVCKLDGWGFAEFQFPEKIPLKLFVKDLLEPEVDVKYNLTEKQIEFVTDALNIKKGYTTINKEIAATETARQFASWNGNYIQFDVSGKGYNSQQDRVFNAEGVMGCIPSAHPENKVNIFHLGVFRKGKWGDGIHTDGVSFTQDRSNDIAVMQQNLVFDNRYKDKGRIYEGVSPTLNSHGDTSGGITPPSVMNCLTEAQGRQGSSKEFLKASAIVSETLKYGKHQQDTLHDIKGISPTIPAGTHGSTPHLLKFNTSNIYRRLTPKECFRLMGFLNDEIKLEGLSDSAKYKLAGNGWEIIVASLLFKQLSLTFQHSA